MIQARNPLYCALDTGDLAAALQLATTLRDIVGGFKLGLEFFTALGPAGVGKIAALGLPLFIDLKLHDIPNTVAGAVRSLMPLGPAILTVHTAGGIEMMQAARRAAEESAGRLGMDVPWIVGVTLLTSLDAGDLDALGIEGSTHRVVARLTRLAEKAGLDGIVCAPYEVSTARSTTGEGFRIIVPGIRPHGAAAHDQKRVMTPEEAVAAGADVIVVGRPITTATDPAMAAQAIVAAITPS
ncbi:MAG: orotidine-5'-phosphate decarboxylase [Rhodothalassiaceae bacterium]